MGSSTLDAPKLASLPIISVEPLLLPNGHGRLSTTAAIHAACSEYGFFYLDISSYVNPSEPEELAELAREFFSRPQEEKDQISITKEDNARGYQKLNENVTNGKADNHEGIDWYRPVENPDKSKPLWGENQWPDIPGFKEKYERWVEKMKNLGLIVMEAMATGLGMTPEEWAELRTKVDDSFWVMRAIGYPPLPGDHDGISCGAHRDYGCLTFLYADPTPGALQVFLAQPGFLVEKKGGFKSVPEQEVEEGGQWINADPIPGCVVCNIGEMWEVWTNGLYQSTLHRVVHRGSSYRIPFFFEPNFDALISPLPAALRLREEDRAVRGVHGGAPRKTYQPVVYGDFLLRKVGSNFVTGKGRYDEN
ncbi:Clavaminate synthase-like protein [Trametes versicolor FP-101664 SS1]|uniref:Clavaminate synthase-like protein n=1 Tax=Trametes versicolor (strain FP-101664) TaxID=717944 RepID=UPI0004623CF9|nr:Clavaminate synthase-like protein [Trametes versicolor FP-101664 SS1]EIW59491.1 Clavaminate synthase-like protein [Trametes versicolor FP-101664 SS1]